MRKCVEEMPSTLPNIQELLDKRYSLYFLLSSRPLEPLSGDHGPAQVLTVSVEVATLPGRGL